MDNYLFIQVNQVFAFKFIDIFLTKNGFDYFNPGKLSKSQQSNGFCLVK